MNHPGYHAYVDGSYSAKHGAYYGVVILKDDVVVKEMHGLVPEEFPELGTRQIAGELFSAMIALTWLAKKAKGNPGEVHMHYDYIGIKFFANGRWQCKNSVTRAYRYYMEGLTFARIRWHHHRGHTGVTYNERAHTLANQWRTLLK